MTKLILTISLPYGKTHTIAQTARLLQVLSIVFRGARVVILSLVVLVGVQLAWPRNRTTPFLSVGYARLGFANQESVNQVVSELNNQKIEIKIAEKTVVTTAGSLGIGVDVEQVSSKVAKYSLQDRLKPFSLFRKSSPSTVTRSIDKEQLELSVGFLAKQYTKQPANAKLKTSKSGKYKVEPSVDGWMVDSDKLESKLAALPLSSEEITVEAPVSEQLAALSADAYKNAVSEYEALTSKPFQIDFGSKKLTVPAKTIRKWVEIKTDYDENVVKNKINTKAISAWLAKQAGPFNKYAQPATVYLHNGKEVKRKAGRQGRVVDTKSTAKAIAENIKSRSFKTSAEYAAIVPINRYIRSYGYSNSGLNALVKDWLKANPGMTAGVVFKQIGSSKGVKHNANKSFGSASLYKLYTAKYLYDKVESGSWKSTKKMPSGHSLSECVKIMIVVSNNTCPKSVGNTYGWSAIQAHISKSLSGIDMASGYPTVTANGAASYMQKLHEDSLMTSKHNKKLLQYMGDQIYRQAIPSGFGSGAKVYDKVGFYGSYWHDAAIIKYKGKSYILVVLTKNGGSSAIKELAQSIKATLDY